MPGRDILYTETNDIANRDSTVDTYAPALVWNRSFLVPRRPKFDKQAPIISEEAGRRLTLPEVRRSLDKAILNFLRCDEGRSYTVEPKIGSDIILFTGAYDDASISAAGAMPRDPKALSPDHRRILGADERALILRGRYDDVSGRYDVAVRVHMRTNLFTVSVTATPSPHIRGLPPLASAQDFDRFTLDFWDAFSAKVMASYAMRRDLAVRPLRGLFADSRGIITSSAVTGEASTPFDASVCWADPVIRYLAPIISPQDARGCTATYMLDRRALSLTTFGSQAPTRASQGRLPLTFVICVHADVLRQHEANWARLIGQVLARSHTITTMRLAALLDVKLLRNASVELAKVDDLKQRARDRISAYEKDEVEGDNAHEAVDDLRKHIGTINSGFLEGNAAGVGLTFRIESSKYYIQEFKKNVEALHLTSIDGYQSYAQTIDKNVGVVFEFISRLGDRYDRLLTEMAGIERSFSNVQSRHTGNQIAELQRNGEVILIGVLVPYYLIQIISHVFGGPDATGEPRHLVWRMINAALWVGWAFYAGYRFKIARLKSTTLREPNARFTFALRTSAIAFATAILLCLSLEAYDKLIGWYEPASSSHPSGRSAAEIRSPQPR